jgi:hypothetical protein
MTRDSDPPHPAKPADWRAGLLLAASMADALAMRLVADGADDEARGAALVAGMLAESATVELIERVAA